ncbi:MAG: DUF1893 domain-containing protein [Muribaculaceae bacterium]|nr:DUF1893 domain-containing protein [Muribaculaceae bacterium]
MIELVNILHMENCSCAIWSEGNLTLCHKRGIIDLYSLLTGHPSVLSDAKIADKVIGKGAAALMILGKVKSVYADIISKPALDLFRKYMIEVQYRELVPNIINRSGTGICPVETLCIDCNTAKECFPYIEKFINKINQK